MEGKVELTIEEFVKLHDGYKKSLSLEKTVETMGKTHIEILEKIFAVEHKYQIELLKSGNDLYKQDLINLLINTYGLYGEHQANLLLEKLTKENENGIKTNE